MLVSPFFTLKGTEMDTTNQSSEQEEQDLVVKKVLVSSFFANFAEWMDYGSYAYLATIIAIVFFPDGDPAVKLMSTYAVFALSFVARPIGAFFWGEMGDRKGRKWSLSVSVLLMTGATACIGLVPSYEAIGITAPILLLIFRLIQGFSAAGEYAGAAIFIAEYAPKEKRGLYTSIVPASTACGLLVGSFLATILSLTLTEDALQSWGWRIPFLLALPIGVVVLRMWSTLNDSEAYLEMVEKLEGKNAARQSPVRLIFTKYFRITLISFGVSSLNAVGFYMVLTYLPVYAETVVELDKATADIITSITLLVYISFIFLSGKISDYFGRKKMLISASIGFIIFSLPCYILLGTGSVILMLVIEILMAFILTINDGTLASFLSETFPTEVRYSGFAISFNLANTVFGGTVGFISTWLVTQTGNSLAPAYYLMGVSAFAFICMIFAKEHKDKELA